MGAGILPTTIHDNKLYFLFGKENELESSAKGWSDFGGGCEKNEKPFQTALREGSEELTGFLGNKNELKELIKKNGGTYNIEHNKYHIHIFYLEYDKNLPKYYNKNHIFLWNKMDKQLLSKSRLFEKIEIKWFSIEDMKKEKKKFRNFYQETVEIFINDMDNIYKFALKNHH